MSKWYKENGFWRRRDNDRSGTGDLIYNSCTKIIQDNDQSDWAYRALGKCIDLLLDGKRWTDSLNTGHEAPNMVVWFIYKLLGRKPLYKPQGRLSRDPFIAVITCAVHLDNTWVVKHLQMPWYLYRHSIWAWRKRLIKDNTINYVKRLRYLRALATVKHFERTNKLWKT